MTPQLALAAAAREIAITHEPGRMFITDVPDAGADTFAQALVR